MDSTHSLPRSAPEAMGIPSSALAAFVDGVNAAVGGLHGLVVVRHGHVVAEGWWAPYRPDLRHMLFSLSKSFTSTAAGLAVGEGLLSLDDPVLPYFPDDAPAEVSENLAAMRLRHLLVMGTGHETDTLPSLFEASDGNWVRAFLARPVERAPGTHFVYNSGATYLVSAIVQKVTGQRVLDYLRPRLFEPLGIADPTWEQCPRGIDTGGWGLSITTEDIARFGQLYLQDGVWNGARLLPAGWAAEATRAHIVNGDDPNNDWTQGYGFQFWRCRHGAYRGDGAFGQYCVVLPAQQTVVAINAGVGDMQAVLNVLWDRLLPALGDAPLAKASPAYAALQAKLAAQTLPTPEGACVGGVSIEGVWALDDGTALEVGPGRLRLGDQEIAFGRDDWAESAPTYGVWHGLPQKSVARAAWTAPDTLTVTVCAVETPFVTTYTLRLDGDALRLDERVNVAFGPAEKPTRTGRR